MNEPDLPFEEIVNLVKAARNTTSMRLSAVEDQLAYRLIQEYGVE